MDRATADATAPEPHATFLAHAVDAYSDLVVAVERAAYENVLG